jgi:hypothetical protein
MHGQRGATILNDAGPCRKVLTLPRWSKVYPADRSACHVTNCTGESGRTRWGRSRRNSVLVGADWQKSALDLKFRFLSAAIGPNSRRANAHARFLYLRPTPNFLPKSRLLLSADKAAARRLTGVERTFSPRSIVNAECASNPSLPRASTLCA